MSSLSSYVVRESPKAKNISINVSLDKGLEIVVPKGYDQSRVPAILQRKQAWLKRATQRIREKQEFLQDSPPNILPDHIYLYFVEEDWQVTYAFLNPENNLNTPATWYEQSQGQLVINSNETEICRQLLRKWLMYKANQYLVPYIQSISKSIKLPFSKVSIRKQKTLWASCSYQKHISINLKLLFLPSSLVSYVLIHELCHTIYMNHSAKFWKLVETKEPNYKHLDQQLNDVWRIIPTWL